MKIIKPNQAMAVSAVRVLVYGQPGAGKTSLALSADYPLLLDFDNGAARSGHRRGDVAVIDIWADALEVSRDKKLLAGYRTLVVDTAGRALDHLSAHLIQEDRKLARRTGELSLQGFGALKAAFTAWLRAISTAGLDVVLVAHAKEETGDGDTKIVRPDVAGGSYGEIMKVADFVGFLSVQTGGRVLDFNPTARAVGKNSAKFPALSVPDLAGEPGYMAGLIREMKAALGAAGAAQADAIAVLDAFRAGTDAAGAGDITSLLDKAREMPKALGLQAFAILKARAEALGLQYNAETKAFEAPGASGDSDET